MVLASFVGLWGLQNPLKLRFPAEFFGIPSASSQAMAERAMHGLRTAPLGLVAADGSVIALAPNQFQRSQWVASPQAAMPDTVIFFPAGPGTKPSLQLAARAGLSRFYQVPGTALRLATNRNLNLKALSLAPWRAPQ